ncbi:DUF1345 domain-containing protein [Hymenobacter crusticola]|uniref:DUF1345 domain-containing protein n=1 Tax=Hymenobacter crusticola TaxID=1770526 RepID=A0A243WJP7_9BACT|nr:DUF1345 domain-containing protein [Hymenobacter crusticola]OUJ75839.1 hypothetical protein BXP70_00635 [Hymenobacter crusticola]
MPNSRSSFRLLHHLGSVSTRFRLVVGLGLGLCAYAMAPRDLHPITRFIAGWDGFAGANLGMFWSSIVVSDVHRIRGVATAEDPGRVPSFVLVLVGAIASVLAVVVLLGIMHAAPGHVMRTQVVLSVAAVASSWLLLHTIFTLRYAHLYYDPEVDGSEGGLEFPGSEKEPDYLDFAYFSFVIGMTAQTADIGISGRVLRRWALLHGVLSYGFNTAIIALSISSLASLL